MYSNEGRETYSISICIKNYSASLDTRRNLSVIERHGRLLNILCAFNLHPVSRGGHINQKLEKTTNLPNQLGEFVFRA